MTAVAVRSDEKHEFHVPVRLSIETERSKLIPRSLFNLLFKINRSPSVRQAQPSAMASSSTGIAFQGDIAVIALENIFQLFDLAALSGKLEVHAATNSGNFYFNQGVLIHGMVVISRRKIGEILLGSQMVTEEQLRECLHLHQQERPQRQFGQILLEKGYIGPAGLNETLVRQIKEAFFEALSWQEGTFAFYHNQFPAPEAIQLQERVDHLLFEGVVYLDNIASLES